MKLINLINEQSDWQFPKGYFLCTKDFTIGGGAWRATTRSGSIHRVNNHKGFWETYNAVDGRWVTRRPPISSHKDFDLSSWSAYDARSWVMEFTKNMKTISKNQAEQMMAGMVKEKSFRNTTDAAKFLGTLDKRTAIKIILMK